MPSPIKLASFDAGATASGGGTSLRIKGGGKIRRFIVNSSNPILVARLAADSVRRRVLRQLQARMPRRTGDMADSLTIRHNKGNVELWGIFYSRFVRRGGSGERIVIAEVMDLIEQHRRAIGNDVIAGLRRA